jgi:MFS family permease
MRIQIIRERLVKSTALVLALSLPTMVVMWNVYDIKDSLQMSWTIALWIAMPVGAIYWIVWLASPPGERFLSLPLLDRALRLRIMQLIIALLPNVACLVAPNLQFKISTWTVTVLFQDFVIAQIVLWGALIWGALPAFLLTGLLSWLTDALFSSFVADPVHFRSQILSIVLSVMMLLIFLAATWVAGWLHLLFMRWVVKIRHKQGMIS